MVCKLEVFLKYLSNNFLHFQVLVCNFEFCYICKQCFCCLLPHLLLLAKIQFLFLINCLILLLFHMLYMVFCLNCFHYLNLIFLGHPDLIYFHFQKRSFYHLYNFAFFHYLIHILHHF